MEKEEVGTVRESVTVGVEPIPAFVSLEGEAQVVAARFEVLRIVGMDAATMGGRAAITWMDDLTTWLLKGTVPDEKIYKLR